MNGDATCNVAVEATCSNLKGPGPMQFRNFQAQLGGSLPRSVLVKTRLELIHIVDNHCLIPTLPFSLVCMKSRADPNFIWIESLHSLCDFES